MAVPKTIVIMHENFSPNYQTIKAVIIKQYKKPFIRRMKQNKAIMQKKKTNLVFFHFFHEEAYLKHPPPMQDYHPHHPGHSRPTDPNIKYQSYRESVNLRLGLVASETASPRISQIRMSFPRNLPLLQCTSAWHCWISWAQSPLLSWRIFGPRLLDCCTSDYSGVR